MEAQEHFTPEPLSPEARHLRTIQEDMQERTNSVVSKERMMRSIPASEDAYDDINKENKSPNKRHVRSANYPTTYRSSSQLKHLGSANKVIETSSDKNSTAGKE